MKSRQEQIAEIERRLRMYRDMLKRGEMSKKMHNRIRLSLLDKLKHLQKSR